MGKLTLLLPRVAHELAALPRLLGRADALPARAPGLLPALAEAYGMPAATLPVAALLRQAAAGDCGNDVWLCADPVYVQADAAGARMLAWGDLGLDAAEAESLARPLRPLLGDAGLLLETTTADRWQLRLAAGTPLPGFSAPEQVLGAALLEHLPAGHEGRRWRALFNEVQMILHQHPRNRARQASGLMPVNALWFWGGGTLPTHPPRPVQALLATDALALALARHAGSTPLAALTQWDGQGACFADAADRAAASAALDAARSWLRAGVTLELGFDDGRRWRITRGQRWRFWRRDWRG